MAGRESFLLEAHRDGLTIDLHVAGESGVVPCVTLGNAAFAVGALGVAFLQLSKNALRFPAEAERDMDGVHAEVAHHADLAAGGGLAFPVGGLVGVEVAAVEETGMDFQHAAQLASAHEFNGLLCAGGEGEFRTHAHEAAAGLGGVRDAPCCGEVNAEGFFGKQILSGSKHVAVNLLVQMMRHGDIDGVDILAREQFAMVGGSQLHGGHLGKPLEQIIAQVAHGHQFRTHRHVREGKPSSETGSRLAPHQAAANDANSHYLAIFFNAAVAT